VNQGTPAQIQTMQPNSPDEEFEKLRRKFQARLRREQTLLTTLTRALGNARIDSALALADIGAFAHRLHGAALVFGFAGIGNLAKAVELAAAPATPNEPGHKDDPSVESTIQALAMILAEETGRGKPCGPAGKSSS
jgi:Hpt domain